MCLESARANAVVHACPTPFPWQAHLVGNGGLGATVWTPEGGIRLLLSRSDAWNEQGGIGSIASIHLGLPPGAISGENAIRQVCRIDEGRIEIEIDAGTITIEALRGRDLLLIRHPGIDLASVALANPHPGDPVSETETLHTNRSSPFAEMCARVGVDPSAPGLRDPILGRSWGVFLERRPGVVAVAIPRAQDDPAKLAEEGRALASAPDALLDRWREEHRAWWRAFWERSGLLLWSANGDAEYEERLWYVALYHLASGHGGPFPMRFNGGPWLLDGDHRSWDYGYWFQNMRELYWPLFAAGHPEMARGFFEMYWEALGFAREQTKSLFGLPGVSFRETQTFWGCSPDADVRERKFNPGVLNYFSGNLEVCLLMDWYVRATGDAAFLRDRLLPMLREILVFYRAFMKPGEDGQLALEPANALETFRNARNPMPDIAGLHALLPKFIAWTRAAGEDAAEWEAMLAHLPPLPVGRWTLESTFREGIHADVFLRRAEADPDGVFLPAEDCRGDDPKLCNMENPELYAVFPWGLATARSGPETRRRLETTWAHRTWKFLNNGWAQDVPQLARMGEGELAAAASLEHASRHQRFPGGGFISPAGPHFEGALTSTLFFDSAGVHAAGINEMLLQSHDGTLAICPATPPAWSGAFRLHSLDGFLVEARFEQGRPLACRVTAPRAGTARIEWEGEKISWDLAAGESFALGTWTPLPERAVAERVWPGFKTSPPPVAARSGHWHDEWIGFGQVGLAADGACPVTRSRP